MDMIEYLRKRRSVRAFDNRPIEPDKIALLKEAVLRSPSSRNFDPWEFIFVDDKQLLEQLSRSKPHGAEFLKDAAVGIVVCADPAVSDVWIEDCAIASILAQLTAQSLGLGSCWIQIRQRFYNSRMSSETYIRNVLGIPEALCVLCIIAVGYPAEYPQPIPRRQLKDAKIHVNRMQSAR
ncbi:MAG TPA: nitroreductase family protein [Anaerohalosphaeraceae bacterium]|nr:nitroreductase family protein [Anaerohalosphaeraceae bacterium]HOL31560.1 nitroreductase family protein [Anaerohalosphaeraceae bacterium]HOM75987.1 nitroreductase family protein [Anaerohalosphaeraceae bacterium]HPC63772.1 nitroreductase family protein [Anaerohalosphaeraceae bacterium]HPO69837.1 nitroreductase family protein [Anaerohalosphaeraceae bacterium]